jgi:type I restriction enzyme S subunit
MSEISPAEQKKIDELLDSIDRLIRLQEKKLETLKRYRTGLRQQLLPGNGGTLPKLRFPKFRTPKN